MWPDPYAPVHRYTCAHCGQSASMMGHIFSETLLVAGKEFENLVCPNSITGTAPHRTGFYCPQPHVCREN